MPDPENSTEEWLRFLEAQIGAAGSQFQLGLRWQIGQALISRWLHPDPERRTTPSEKTLQQISERSGVPLADLYRMTGRRLPDVRAAKEKDPPEIAALISDIRRRAVEMTDEERGIRINATNALWGTHEFHRRGRPRRNHSAPDHESLMQTNDSTGVASDKNQYLAHTHNSTTCITSYQANHSHSHNYSHIAA